MSDTSPARAHFTSEDYFSMCNWNCTVPLKKPKNHIDKVLRKMGR